MGRAATEPRVSQVKDHFQHSLPDLSKQIHTKAAQSGALSPDPSPSVTPCEHATPQPGQWFTTCLKAFSAKPARRHAPQGHLSKIGSRTGRGRQSGRPERQLCTSSREKLMLCAPTYGEIPKSNNNTLFREKCANICSWSVPYPPKTNKQLIRNNQCSGQLCSGAVGECVRKAPTELNIASLGLRSKPSASMFLFQAEPRKRLRFPGFPKHCDILPKNRTTLRI